MKKSPEEQATTITQEHPNHIVGSSHRWHWSFYHSGMGMATGWANSKAEAEAARNQAAGELLNEGDK